MIWLFIVLCLSLGFHDGFGEECAVKNRQFGDSNVVFGENELGEEAAVTLDRIRRSFYRSVFILFFLGSHHQCNITLGVEQLLVRRHLRP